MATSKDFIVKNGLQVNGDVTFTGTLTGDGSGLTGAGVTSYNDLTDKPTIPTAVSQLTNDSGYLTSYTETDPIYTASSWYTTTNNSGNWDTAYGWGNHASAGYLTSAQSFNQDLNTNNNVRFSQINVGIAGGLETIIYNDGITINGDFVVKTTDLSNYASLSAASNNFTGDIQIDGDLTVSGTTVTINATNLAVQDNMIYLNNGSTVANPDLGIAGNYNDGTYAHAGLFRDATDGRWKFYDSYTPEPDDSAYINTSHASFNLATVQAGAFIGDGSGLTGINAPTNYFNGLQIGEDVYTATGAENIIFDSSDSSVSISRNANILDFTANGSWEKLLDNSYTSPVSSISIDGFFSSEYDRYILYFSNILNEYGGSANLRFYTNGSLLTSGGQGGSYASGQQVYNVSSAGVSLSSYNNNWNNDWIELGETTSWQQGIDSTNSGLSGIIEFIDPNANFVSSQKYIEFKTHRIASGALTSRIGFGTYFNYSNNFNNISGINLFPMFGGQMTVQNIVLYGIKK